MLLSYMNDCKKPSRKHKVHSMYKAERQKWYYARKANAVSPETGDLVLAKADAYKGKRKVKDWWEEELYKVECQELIAALHTS